MPPFWLPLYRWRLAITKASAADSQNRKRKGTWSHFLRALDRQALLLWLLQYLESPGLGWAEPARIGRRAVAKYAASLTCQDEVILQAGLHLARFETLRRKSCTETGGWVQSKLAFPHWLEGLTVRKISAAVWRPFHHILTCSG